MKKVIFILLLSCLFSNKGLATVYYVCGNVTWNGSHNNLYTSSDCTTGGPSSPVLTTADEIIIQAGAVVLIQNQVDLDVSKLTVFGTLYIKDGANPGKLQLPSNSATVVLQPGSVLGCFDGIEVPCGSSDQIIVGSGADKFTYNGAEIDQVDALPKPTTLDNVGTPLPIQLLSFKAAKGLAKVNLSWSTYSELNFDYFDIEKSSDGKNFQSIAKVTGHGTTNERQDYALEDEKPYIGKNYYRLKSVDYDGYTEYFNVVLVDFDGSKAFSIAPNPSDGITFTAETNFVPQTRSYVAIYSTLGSEIGRYEVAGNKSMLTLPVKLESGVYYAKYISGEFTATSRVVVR